MITPPTGLRPFTFIVRRSQRDDGFAKTVFGTNSRDAAFAAIGAVRREQSIPEHVTLFATR